MREKKAQRIPVFKERLEILFQESGNSIAGYAKTLGITRQTLGFYLNGDRIPDIETVGQISRACGVSSDWLIGLTDVRSPDTKIKALCDYTGLSELSVKLMHDYKDKDDMRFYRHFATNMMKHYDEFHEALYFNLTMCAAMTLSAEMEEIHPDSDPVTDDFGNTIAPKEIADFYRSRVLEPFHALTGQVLDDCIDSLAKALIHNLSEEQSLKSAVEGFLGTGSAEEADGETIR